MKEDRKRIEESEYWKYYRRWQPEVEGANYWKDKRTEGREKEIWARIRVGNISKEGKKGFREMKCRVCDEEEETLNHVWTCRIAKEEMKEESRKWIEEWSRGKEGDQLIKELEEELKGEVNRKSVSTWKNSKA